MTTKPKASLYRLKPGAALAAGVDEAAIARASAQVAQALQVVPEAQGAPEHSTPQAQTPSGGEVASPADIDCETALAAIRREGLTGRQLRMARRIAAKHNLAPTSDFDAVRLLRAQGIDPFQRNSVLSLTERAPSSDAPQPKVQLPQTLAPNRPPMVAPELKLPEDRAGEILQIQRDIAKRRQRKLALLIARLGVFVMLPTLIVGWYFFIVATPMYATNSEFVIQQAEGQAAGGLGGLFAGTGLAVSQDSTTVQSYLQSRDAMRRLDQDLAFKAHYSDPEIDPIQRLAADASNEDAYEVYKKAVRVGFDPTEGILKMEVIAASPESSEAFAKALIGYAEEQVDNLTQRLRVDQMAGAMENFETAEARVQAAQERVLELQERLGVLDPISETGSLMSQITQFELQLRQKELERDQILSNARPNAARVEAVEGDISRLAALVADLRASMTEGQNGAASLARVSGELRIAEADLATRQLLLQQAALQLETARIEANRQVRYMAVGVTPVAPDEPTYPRALENTALAFVIFAGIYLMISLTAAVLREQVSA